MIAHVRVAVATVGFVLAVAVALVIERSLLAPLPLAVPDLVALLVAAGAMAFGARVGAGWGLLAGLLCDLAPPASGVVGAWALAYVCCGFGLGLMWERRWGVAPRGWYAAAVAAVAVGATVVHALVLVLFGEAAVWRASTLPAVGLTALYGVVLGLAVGPQLERLLAGWPARRASR